MKSKTNNNSFTHLLFNPAQSLEAVRLVFSLALVGILLTLTHGCYLRPARAYTMEDIEAKSLSDIKTHSDITLCSGDVFADPRRIKGIKRSDTD